MRLMGVNAVHSSVEGGQSGVEDVVSFGYGADTVKKPENVFGGRARIAVLVGPKDEADDSQSQTTPNLIPAHRLQASGESNVEMTAAKRARILENIEGKIIREDIADLLTDDIEAKLTASGESQVEMTPAKKERIVESMEGKQIATAIAVQAVKDNVEAKPSLAEKKHGST